MKLLMLYEVYVTIVQLYQQFKKQEKWGQVCQHSVLIIQLWCQHPTWATVPGHLPHFQSSSCLWHSLSSCPYLSNYACQVNKHIF